MPINFRYYLNKTLFFLTTPTLVGLLYLYGNNEVYFDWIYIGALSLSCVFCFSDKDTLGALLILLGYWLLSKALYMAPDSWYADIPLYTLCLALGGYYWRSFIAKALIVIVLFSAASELYWHYIDYANKPQMVYWVGLLALTMWAKQLLYNRIIIADAYFGYTSGKTSLDDHIGHILTVYFVLVVLMILEYFVRHLGGMKDVTTIYYLFTLVANLISALTIAVIYMHYFYYQSQRSLKA